MKGSQVQKKEGLSTIGIVVLFLSTIAGVIHLLQDDPILKLNGVGYFILAIGVVFKHKDLKSFNEVAPKMLAVYATTTIAMYFLLNGDQALENNIGLVTKAVEFLLIGILLVHQRVERQNAKTWVAQSNRRRTSW